jgi:hypothetical protein
MTGSSHKFGGRWTEQKLGILRKYLSAYTKALSRKQFETAYIDAFAGRGIGKVALVRSGKALMNCCRFDIFLMVQRVSPSDVSHRSIDMSSPKSILPGARNSRN